MCMANKMNSSVCFFCLFLSDFKEEEALLTGSDLGLIDRGNSVGLISQCRFRVGCENDTGLIKCMYF